MTPFAVISDIHLHNWQAFSGVNEDGENTRLAMLLDEIDRCSATLQDAGGDSIYITGDVFHVRGSVAPSVFNPALQLFSNLKLDGMKVYVLAGNHDLEHKTSDTIGNAVRMLGDSVRVIVEPTRLPGRGIFIPWIESIDALKEEIVKHRMLEENLFIHAPIDGVIKGLPDHGLTAEWLGEQGFKRVFSGHYHNFKDFGNGVYSVGALAHHTWSDVGSKAGFLIAYPDGGVRRFASHVPSFIDVTDAESKEEIELLADGNYIRVKIELPTTGAVEEMRSFLTKSGAKGTLIQAVRAPSHTRDAKVSASVSSGASLEVSITEFIKSKEFEHIDALQKECQTILAEAS